MVTLGFDCFVFHSFLGLGERKRDSLVEKEKERWIAGERVREMVREREGVGDIDRETKQRQREHG